MTDSDTDTPTTDASPPTVYAQQRGFLTKDDRAYLTGEKTYAHDQTEANTRQRIRRRIRAALYDFHLLLEHHDDDEREAVFHPPREIRPLLSDGIAATIAYLYLGTVDSVPSFPVHLKRGLTRAEQHRRASDTDEPEVLSVELVQDGQFDPTPIFINDIDLQTVRDAIADGEVDTLTTGQMRRYLQAIAHPGEYGPFLPSPPPGWHRSPEDVPSKRTATDHKSLPATHDKEEEADDDE